MYFTNILCKSIKQIYYILILTVIYFRTAVYYSVKCQRKHWINGHREVVGVLSDISSKIVRQAAYNNFYYDDDDEIN